MTDDGGAVYGVQRTWLAPRSPARADVASPRKALGRVYGHVVRFGRPAGVAPLVIARDNDAEGERAAMRLARRCARARSPLAWGSASARERTREADPGVNRQ